MWLKVSLIQLHQKIIFSIYFPVFRRKLQKGEEISDDLLTKIVYGWGNMGYSSEHTLARAIIDYTSKCNGSVLECGSGLSTIIMGIIAMQKNINVYSLEHHKQWHQKVSSVLAKQGLKNSILYHTPLKSYDSFDWYNLENKELPSDFDLVLCDGPPAQTKGGRIGLIYLMDEHISRKATIIVDDYMRVEEKKIVENWISSYDYTLDTKRTNDVFAILVKD